MTGACDDPRIGAEEAIAMNNDCRRDEKRHPMTAILIEGED